MATAYKFLTNNDKVVSTTNQEQTASINPSFTAIRRSFFSEVASGSTHVFDVTFGRASTLPLSGSDATKEKNIYNQMAKTLLGYDSGGNILKFSLDENASQNDNLLNMAYFVNFARSQTQDKIKVGSFNMNLTVSGSTTVTLRDSGSNGFELRDCNTGQYGILYASGSGTGHRITASVNDIHGLLFYEAGVAVISPFLFAASGTQDSPQTNYTNVSQNKFGVVGTISGSFSGSTTFADVVTGSLIGDAAYGLYNSINSCSFQATTELNSSIYFCRAFNNEFNFSSNPTYLSASEIIVKGGEPTNQPVSYITSVGLYDDKNQLLAVAKLSEPVKKTPDTELIARVRLDF